MQGLPSWWEALQQNVPDENLQKQRQIAQNLDIGRGEFGDKPILRQARDPDQGTEYRREHDPEHGNSHCVEHTDDQGAQISVARLIRNERVGDRHSGLST